ncbi:DUF4440 domain-containing protein [Pontibacillus salicampi]|uniref:DUF4440 domain-containing protein n=1 Tax=Pontibacillus salicampi TaxID=1449801 RepID=A0ABV6LK93_9BACI
MELSELKEYVQALEEKLLTPEVRTNETELGKLLGPTFFEYGISGVIWHRKDCVKPNGINVRDMHLSQFDVQLLAPDVILATYQLNDRTRGETSLRSSIWKRTNHTWQMIFHQGTKAK